MRTVISPRRTSGVMLAALLVSLAFASAARATEKTWNLAADFPLVQQNPAYDKYGHKVWAYMYGTENTPSTYRKLPYYFSPAQLEAECNIKEFYQYDFGSNANRTPAIFYNGGETVPAGPENHCDHSEILPGKTVFMHPEANGNLDAVVRWKSTVTGTVMVAGSVECVDESVSGISWQLDHNSTVVLGPTEVHDNLLHTFGPIAVPVTKIKEYLYFEIKHAAGASGTSDSTAVNLTITGP